MLSPNEVARVIVQAVESPIPGLRYKVGAEAEQIPAMRPELSDRQRDAMYRQWLDLTK